jgi:hypothetical protein
LLRGARPDPRVLGVHRRQQHGSSSG